jgi:hypothetical protein
MRSTIVLVLAIYLLSAMTSAFVFRGPRIKRCSIGRRSHDDDVDMPEMDYEALMQRNNVPKAPTIPEEIVKDSFEGYLRSEFNSLLEEGKEQLDFTSFYMWRHKMGIVYSEQEMINLFNNIVEEEGKGSGLTLMGFIKMNKIIDESNTAVEDQW